MDIKNNSVETFLPVLMKDLYFIINSAKTNVAYTANQELTLMHWRMGERINREVLGNERAAYGKQIVAQVARQLKADLGTKGFDEKSLRRMIIDGEDFYLDLLFYHRRLHRLIAVDLKLGRFKAQYKGQMELYLRWLEKNEMESGEESPLGLLLCTEGSEEQIELLQLDKSGIKVAQYMTELPPRDVLIQQVRKSMEIAKGLGKY